MGRSSFSVFSSSLHYQSRSKQMFTLGDSKLKYTWSDVLFIVNSYKHKDLEEFVVKKAEQSELGYSGVLLLAGQGQFARRVSH